MSLRNIKEEYDYQKNYNFKPNQMLEWLKLLQYREKTKTVNIAKIEKNKISAAEYFEG